MSADADKVSEKFLRTKLSNPADIALGKSGKERYFGSSISRDSR